MPRRLPRTGDRCDICRSVAAGRSRLFVAYFVTTQVALSYFLLAIARRFRRPEAIERLTRGQAPQERPPHRGRDPPAARPVHQGRPAHQHHGELPARRVPRGAAAAAGSGAAAPVPRHRGAPARGVRRPRPDRAVRGVLARAGGVGVDRPGPPRAPAQRRGGRGQGPVPGHRGDRAHRPAGAAPHLQGAALVHARLRLRHHLPRDPRDGAGRARLPARGGGDREDRGQLRRARQRHERPLPARDRRVLDGARAHHRVDGGDQGRAPRAARQPEDRSAGGRARLRRGLLRADLHRRPVSRRSAPREPAGPAAAAPGSAADDRVPGLRRDRARSARGCGAG